MLSNGFAFLRATQSAAIAASQFIGSGNKLAIDGAATDAMRLQLNGAAFRGEIVVGEGEKDNAPGLFKGEIVGKCTSNEIYDIALDPIDGTSPAAKMGPEAMSVVAVGDTNHLFPAPSFYMKKLAVGPLVAQQGKINLNWDLDHIVYQLAIYLKKPIDEVTVCLLDRPRHEVFIKEFRRVGCKVKLIADCDVSGAIATALHSSPVDLYYGIGGAPEGVIAAAAMKCLGGYFEGMLVEQDGTPLESNIYESEELAKGEVLFCATGVTTGSMLRGVKKKRSETTCHSVLMHYPTKNIHWVRTDYPLLH